MAKISKGEQSAFSRGLESLIFENRGVVLLLFTAITAVMLFFALQLKVDAGFRKQVPLKHEYMKTFLEYEKEFGGANRVLVAVMAKDGKMFTAEYMTTLDQVTDDVMNVTAVDKSRTRSIFTPNVRFTEVVEDGFAGGNVIPADFTPKSPTFAPSEDDFNKIHANIVKAGIVGRLVAKDFSGAMVQAELVPESTAPGGRLDYQGIAAQLEAIRSQAEKANPNATVHIIGFAKMVGDISDGARSVIKFFGLTIALTWVLLFLYSTSGKLASLTVLAAFVSVIWMLGALRLMGYGIDPMNMLTPFLIFAIAVSHGEQMINRFRGEIFFGGLEDGSVEELRARAKNSVGAYDGARAAFRMLLVPGAVALLAGCIGFGTIMIIDIKMVRELAVTATVGVGFTLLTDLILLPVLLSYTHLSNLDRKREYRLRQLTKFDMIWRFLAKFSRPTLALLIIAIGTSAWYFARQEGSKVMVGDAQKGVAELRADAKYNLDAETITSRFALGVDIINVIAEAGPFACTENPRAMELIDRFAWHMSNVEGVQQVITLPQIAKIIYAGYNEGNLRWRAIPRDPNLLRQSLQNVETDTGLIDSPECKAMPIMIFTTDHQATTIDRVVSAVKSFRQANGAEIVDFRVKREAAMATAAESGEEFRTDQVNLRLATGNVGVMAAINDEVRRVDHSMFRRFAEDIQHVDLWTVVKQIRPSMLEWLYTAVFLMAMFSFGSARAALCIVLPLVLVTELGNALMVHLGIGLKVNTLTVVALGVGIGVDYAIYIFARMDEAMKQGKTLSESYFSALKTTGIAIFYTALTLASGVFTWYWSDLKFQADMGVMLTFMFVVNMLAAIVFLPALCRWFLRPNEQDARV
ncbi:MAG: RND family transporter [Lysobacterales bacterium]